MQHDAPRHHNWNALIGGLIIMIGSVSAVIGYMLAVLESGQRANTLHLQTLDKRIVQMDETVSSVDVYDLRISNLENEITANIARLRAAEVILTDLRSDLNVLFDRQRLSLPDDDKRDQYYLPLGQRKTQQ